MVRLMWLEKDLGARRVRVRGSFSFGALIASAAVFVTVSANSVLARPLDPLTPDEQGTRIAELAHAPWSGRFSEKVVDYDFGCIYSKVTLPVVDPVSGETKELVVDVSRPMRKRPAPVVVVVPTIEGVTILEPSIAAQLCDAGIATIISDVNDNSQPEVLPAWGHEDKVARHSLISLRTVLDFAEKYEKFDGTRLGVMGLSLGGITSSMLAGLEPERLKAAVIAVGGANIPYILANSDNSKVDVLRQRRMIHLGINTPDQYEEELRKTVRFDPFYFADRVRKERVLMVMAEKDTKVPFMVQRELFEAYGQPQSILFKGSHVGSLAKLVFLYMDTIVDFFKKRFSSAPQLFEHRIIRVDDIDLN